jgi:hypothetical protein
MDFKFVSHGLWSEKQNILRQHMHKKEFNLLNSKVSTLPWAGDDYLL